MMDWFAPLQSIKGINDILSRKFAKLGITCLGDLLLHFPFRYEDHTRITPISCLKDGQTALIEGKIVDLKQAGRQKKRIVLELFDRSGICEIVFFHFFPSQRQQWINGNVLRCFGQVKRGSKHFQMVHPDWVKINEEETVPLPIHLTPIYSTVTGLTQARVRKTIEIVLSLYEKDPLSHQNYLPSMLTLPEAFRLIHFPPTEIDPVRLAQKDHPAYHRLIIEELISHHFSLQKIKEENNIKLAKKIKISEKESQAFIEKLPFELTGDQKKVWQAIREDLSQEKPMLRLLQGDVGCGKTVVAALAAWAVVQAGQQVALMVPTEILAEQHFQQFQTWFSPFQIACSLLTGKLKAKEKKSREENIALGNTKIIIGTHALLQENVHYPSLGLIIIDEQHRFGVHQRLALKEKGTPHQLIMTATPIPRTLAMSHYAHLDLSTITSMPPGRQAIKTLVIPQSRREEIIDRIKAVCASGQQVYWVCTLIAESEHLECQDAEERFATLVAALPDCRVGLVHGKIDPLKKAETMHAFHRGEINVLVATTVIEVGVNVPNATLMVIENAERLGLAQLHQLRGRVGRGHLMSFCVLLYQSPLSEVAKSRLSVLKESQDGFVIAEADLELRGPGEMLGTKQTGTVEFKVADLQRDKNFIESLPTWLKMAESLTEQEIETMIRRWLGRLDYVHA